MKPVRSGAARFLLRPATHHIPRLPTGAAMREAIHHGTMPKAVGSEADQHKLIDLAQAEGQQDTHVAQELLAEMHRLEELLPNDVTAHTVTMGKSHANRADKEQ